MSSFPVRLVCAVAVTLLILPPGWAVPTAEEITRAVKELGSDNFRDRQQATTFLWKAGKAAEPALRKALRSDDKEVVRRARDLLDKFKYGIYPDTPKKVLELIARYRAGNAAAKQAAIDDLSSLGSPGHAVLIKLAALEDDDVIRRILLGRLTNDVVPGLLAAARYDEVEELLEIGIKKGDEQAMRNYAAFLLLRGNIGARMPRWAAQAKKLSGFRASEVLMYLYRAKGDLKNALVAARKIDRKELVASLLAEQADWKELAANYGAPEVGPLPLHELGYKAAYQRLAGNRKEFDKAVAAIRQHAASNPEELKKSAQALLLNYRTREALELLLKGNEPAFAFELLAAQHRYREAFDLAAKAKGGPDPAEMFNLKTALARTHALLGDREQATKVLAKLADEYFDPQELRSNPFGSYCKVIDTENQLGLKDQAFAHGVKILARADKEKQLTPLFNSLFPEKGSRAFSWWEFFRQAHAGDTLAATLKRVRDLFEKKVAAKDFIVLARAMARAAARLDREQDRQQWLDALAETCLTYKEDKLAQAYLHKAGTAASLTRLGDLLAEKKLWSQAAERYGEAWTSDRSSPLPLYLRGWSLQQGGKKPEGAKLIALAHMVPLGNDRSRFKMAQALARHGLSAAADKELAFLLHTGRFNYAEISNALAMLGLKAYARKDYRRAAEYHERTILVCFGYIYFTRPTAYLTLPAAVRHIRARGLLAGGKVDEALKEVRGCLESIPGDIEAVIHVFPNLVKMGRKKEAEELFKSVWDHYEKVCKAFPKSAQHQNTIAWLGASCRRQLDKALAHARKAVDLAPKSAGYLDTLAEVYYQRGDKTEALKLMKKCIQLDPSSDYYPKQIKRFEAKGPPSETPR